MIKTFRKHLSSDFKRWMKSNASDFSKISPRMSGTSWSGCDVFSKEGGDKRQAWIVLGGTSSESYVTAVLYWTTEGTPWEELRGWDPQKDLQMPRTGGLQLVDELLVGSDLVDGSRMLELPEPPVELRDLAIDRSKRIDLYKRVRQRTISDLSSKSPRMSDLEIEDYLMRADQLQFGMWEGIERVIQIPLSHVESALKPLEDKVFYLLEKYGLPFLEKRLTGTLEGK